VRGYEPVADSARSAVIVAELRVQLIIHHGFVILFQLYGVIGLCPTRLTAAKVENW
jgi:hypothetical protein